MGPESCTAEVKFTDEFTFEKRAVFLTDFPGFDDTAKSGKEILEITAAHLVHE